MDVTGPGDGRGGDEARGFLASLGGAVPPSGFDTPALRGVWHGLRGEWDAAHAAAQEAEGTPDADWVHAWLHRVEGDAGNAAYWYRRAGRPAGTGDTGAEGRAIAAALLAGGAAPGG